MSAGNNNPQNIDWEKVWKSLAWVDHNEDEATIRQRLQQRARQYAAPKQQPGTTAEDGYTVLTFALGTEHYGVDVMRVRGVRALTTSRLTHVPGVPAFYRGVVNVRGQVITVLDLRLFFAMPADDGDNIPGELVIVRSGMLEIGLLAHDVEGVEVIPRSEVEPVDNMRYALGVTAAKLVLLDIKHLFEDERLLVGGKDEYER